MSIKSVRHHKKEECPKLTIRDLNIGDTFVYWEDMYNEDAVVMIKTSKGAVTLNSTSQIVSSDYQFYIKVDVELNWKIQ